MRSLGIKSFIVALALVFFGDAINCDILIAEGVNALFHTRWNSISREVIAGNANATVSHSTRSIASTVNPGQDEDSPTTLDTAFPVLSQVLPLPKEPAVSTSDVAVRHTYLSLCTLLI